MAAHRHFTSKLLMKWRGSDGLQLLNWQSLKLLVLRSQVSSINHHCYWRVVGFVAGNVQVCSDFTVELWCSWTYMFRISSFRGYPFPCHYFNFGDWYTRIKIWPHGWQVGFQPTSAVVQIVLSSVRLCLLLSHGMRLSFDHLVYFVLPKIVLVIIIYAFQLHFIFLWTLFHKFLEPHRHITFKINSSVCDGFIIIFWTLWLRPTVLWA